MADRDFQVILKHSSGLPENSFVNTLHFDIGGSDSAEDTCDGIHAAYSAMNPFWSADISGMTIKVYEPGPNPSGPIFSKDYSFSGSNGSAPYEVALCMSYASVDDPDASLPRRRGRIYLGPVNGGVGTGSRPDSTIIAKLIALGEDLAQIGSGLETTWKLYSRTDNAYAKIESVFVDNAWDTQRRRGLRPTTRSVQDVQ